MKIQKMKKILLAVVLHLTVGDSIAKSNWIYFGLSSDESKLFLEENSTHKNGDFISYWLRANLSQMDKYGHKSMKIQYKLNCKKREFTSQYYMIYNELDNKGKIQEAFRVDDDWVPVSPDSITWNIYKFLCK